MIYLKILAELLRYFNGIRTDDYVLSTVNYRTVQRACKQKRITRIKNYFPEFVETTKLFTITTTYLCFKICNHVSDVARKQRKNFQTSKPTATQST